MSRKAKDLDQLIRVNQWGVDERQRELGVLLSRDDELIAQDQRLDAELAMEQSVAASDPTNAGFLFGGYVGAYRLRKQQVVQLRRALAAEIEEARERLAEAFRQLKVYEEVQKERAQREREEEAREEQIMMDEIGMTQYRRRQEEDAA